MSLYHHLTNAITLETKKNNGIPETAAYYCSNNVVNWTQGSTITWVISRVSDSGCKKEATLHISDRESKISVEFQAVQQSPGNGAYNSAYFKISSSLHTPGNRDKAELFGKVRSRISVLHYDNSGPYKTQVIRSKWTPIVDPTFYLFDDNKTILGPILTTDKLYGSGTICGRLFYSFILVGIEFQSSKEASPSSILTSQELALLTMDKMYNTKTFADVEILAIKTNDDGTLAGTKTSIMAHKAILSAQSMVFETMLRSQYTEGKLSVIEIMDFEPGIIQELLKYLYLGNPDLENFALDLLRISDKYNILHLMEICQLYIANNIPKFGWTSIFELIQTYEARVPVLKENIAQYYKKYETTLKNSPDFLAAMKKFPEIFYEVYTFKNEIMGFVT